MPVEIPQLDPEIYAGIERLKASPKMAKALQIAFDEAISQIATYYLAALKVNFIKKETQHD